MSASVEQLLRLLGSPAAMRAIGPDLSVGEGVSRPGADAGLPPVPTVPRDPGERSWLVQDGFGMLRDVGGGPTCSALVRAVENLGHRGLPASFVYAFDETWAIGDRTCQRISTLMEREYVLVEDVWAWSIAPGTGRGWPAHRGIAHERLDREAPEVINVWVALTDVTPERACMHAIPLDDDPSYPHTLEVTTAPLTAVRALPATAGDALFWNANVLHWGGRCAARSPGPRVSCSFTLCRADAASRFPELTLLAPLATFDLPARMDAVARMVLLYGDEDRGDVRGVVREWATLTRALVSRFATT